MTRAPLGAGPRAGGMTQPRGAASAVFGLEMRNVSKHYGGVAALHDVSISLKYGETLALCGANGAGKSTLVKILAGAEKADSGQIVLDENEVVIDSPRAASDHGLSFVHQELNLIPKFNGLQNMALGLRQANRFGVTDRRALRARARDVCDMLGHNIVLDVPVEKLPVAERWMVSLGRSLMRPARVVALDEPTASFTNEEAERLYRVLEQLKGNGVGILYISHRLEEVLQLADRVCVMRNGAMVGMYGSDSLDAQALTRHIVGGEVETIEPPGQSAPAQAVRLSVRGLGRPPLVQAVSFDVHVGEILGVAGLVGSGRTEIARMLVGADVPAEGEMTLDGQPYAARSPHEALRRGVCLVPEERRSQGLVLTDSIENNLQMAAIGATRHLTNRHRPRGSRRIAATLIQRLGIKARSSTDAVHRLSGGNQQKVVLGKYVRTQPRLLILDEPAVGVDVGARAEIFRIVTELAAGGTSVLMISSDFDELAICHRVLVVRGGSVVATVSGASATKNRLTQLSFAPADNQEVA